MKTTGSALADVAVASGTGRARVPRAHLEALCAGHFPEDPLVPGAYLAELMAELAALVVATPGRPPAEILRCVFLRPVRPGRRVALEAQSAGRTRVEAAVLVDGAPAARAWLRFGSAA